MVTNVSDWDEAMRLVQHCRSNLEERGVPYKTDVPFGIMLSIPAACLTAEDFVKHGCELYKLIQMAVNAAGAKGIPVSICGLAVGDPDNAVQYLHMGLRSFSMGPQNLLSVKKALLESDALPDREGPPAS